MSPAKRCCMFLSARGPVGCMFSVLFLLLSGCANGPVWVLPPEGSVQLLPLDVEIHWVDGMDSQTLNAKMNSLNLLPELLFGDNHASAYVPAVPGRKLLSAFMQDVSGFPYTATSVFTAVSAAPRESFPGGAMRFTCESSFVHSALQVPGFDLDSGFTEEVCKMLTVQGVFPPGDSEFPVSSDPLPLLYGIFPKQVVFDADKRTPNGISISPVAVSMSLPFDPSDQKQRGRPCALSFLMHGTILPVDDGGPTGTVLAGMTLTVRGLSLSIVGGQGECSLLSTFPAWMDLITFNYVAAR